MDDSKLTQTADTMPRELAASDQATLVPRAGFECPVCRQHFSGSDAHFCPFDGEPLVPSESWHPEADPLIGMLIDKRYQILEVLGEGGMGTVYHVQHAALGRPFALKALRRELAADKELSARFIQEARAAAAVSHPSVVQIIDFGTLPTGQAYFVMELLHGQPLSWLLHDVGTFPPARGLRIARQIAEALGAAHAAGVIHRDLKPDNVHVAEGSCDRDIVKVLDFGLAKVAGASRLTRAGMVFGTPHYMSPEQASGEVVDHRSDIYSLGVVMYEMLTGRVPFEADSYMGVLTKHMYVMPAPPSEIVGGSEQLGALEQVVLRCLAKSPDQRYASMTEVLDALEAVTVKLARLELPVENGVESARGSAAEMEAAPVPQAAPFAPAVVAPEREFLPPRLRWRKPLAIAMGTGVVTIALLVASFGWRSAQRPTSVAAAPDPGNSAHMAGPSAPASAPPVEAARRPAAPDLSADHAQISASKAAVRPEPKAAPAPPNPVSSPRPRARTSKAKKGRRGSLEGSEIVDPWAE